MTREEICKEVVAQLNKMNQAEDSYHSFWYKQNDFMDVILFDEIPMWDSEGDGPGEFTVENLFEYVVRAFDDYKQHLFAFAPAHDSVKRNLQHLFNDITMLKEGDWVPDEHSCDATLDTIERIASKLNIELE